MTKPIVILDDDGTRRVIHGAYESWRTYHILPRSLILGRIRALRAAGRAWNSIEEWEYSDLNCGAAHYSGPGLSFSDEPRRLRYGRQFVVYTQHGGLDV